MIKIISNKKVIASIPVVECYLSENEDKKIPLVYEDINKVPLNIVHIILK
jgi:hypothetical protein